MSDTLGMLQELLEQDQFELPDTEEAKKTGTLHLVYLMNDAVESFLVFQDARMTGTYKKDYEEELEYSLSQDRETYILSVWQGDSVVTVLFRKLELEVHLYNYGEIGHFWVKGWEYLRQLLSGCSGKISGSERKCVGTNGSGHRCDGGAGCESGRYEASENAQLLQNKSGSGQCQKDCICTSEKCACGYY